MTDAVDIMPFDVKRMTGGGFKILVARRMR